MRVFLRCEVVIFSDILPMLAVLDQRLAGLEQGHGAPPRWFTSSGMSCNAQGLVAQ